MDRNSDKKPISTKTLGFILAAAVTLLVVFCLLFIKLNEKKDGPIGTETPPVQSETASPLPSESEPLASPSQPFEPGYREPGFDPTMEPIEPTEEDLENMEKNNEQYNQEARYINNGYYYYDYDQYGDYMSVGVDAGDSNMIYLNPQAYVYGCPDAKVGFYITATRGNIIMANENWAGVSDGENASHQYFMINWTYDELVPADYQDSQGFGIAWQDNFLEDGQYAGADIYIRAIDLSNRYKLLTVAKATIAYDPEANTYRLSGVWNEDVSATGQMSAEDRAELVSRAYDLATNKVYFPNQVVVNKLSALGTKEEITGQAIVEYLGKTLHFPEFSSASGRPVRSSYYADWFDDIYAVSLPVREKGFITLYYSADAEPLSESPLAPADVVDISPATSLGLNFFGTDFYCPETRTR